MGKAFNKNPDKQDNKDRNCNKDLKSNIIKDEEFVVILKTKMH